jgi:hypothetical protein
MAARCAATASSGSASRRRRGARGAAHRVQPELQGGAQGAGAAGLGVVHLEGADHGIRVEPHLSRQLIRDSRALIAAAQALIAQSRQSLARQSSIRIVCAWCQATIRFERSAVAARGQVSHSICYDCFAHVFGELDSVSALPPLFKKMHEC